MTTATATQSTNNNATATETPADALARIQSAGFGKNDAAVIYAFADRGIDPADIEPRENVLTYRAWKAKGRQVAKGAISVKVVVYIERKATEGKKATRFPKSTAVFHISQTIPAEAEKGMAQSITRKQSRSETASISFDVDSALLSSPPLSKEFGHVHRNRNQQRTSISRSRQD